MITRASPADADRAALLTRLAEPDRVLSAAGLRHVIATEPPEDCMDWWKAERGGEMVGWASGGLDSFASDRTDGRARVAVHPEHRREGIGSQLWSYVSEHLERIGARRVIAFGQSDEGSVAFAVARGFVSGGVFATSSVDPRLLPPPPVPPAGIEIVPLRHFDADPEPVYAADFEAALDEPGPSDSSGMSYATWRRTVWDMPDCDLEIGMAAVERDAVVGMTFVFVDRGSGRAGNGGTGVVRAARGRGLGLLMKQHSLARAAAAGITSVITGNDETNAPMLAINARLGYRPVSTGRVWVLER